MRLFNTTFFSNRLFVEKEAEMKSLQTQLTVLKTQANTGFSILETVTIAIHHYSKIGVTTPSGPLKRKSRPMTYEIT